MNKKLKTKNTHPGSNFQENNGTFSRNGIVSSYSVVLKQQTTNFPVISLKPKKIKPKINLCVVLFPKVQPDCQMIMNTFNTLLATRC